MLIGCVDMVYYRACQQGVLIGRVNMVYKSGELIGYVTATHAPGRVGSGQQMSHVVMQQCSS